MKTKHLALISTLLVALVLLSGCATGMTPSSWPGIIADANNAYVAGGQYVYAVNLQTGAQVWRFPEKATANPFYATPMLTADGTKLIVGGFDKKLYCLDAKTGASLWQFTEARDRWVGGALVTDSMIYAANSDYKLYALDLQGNLKWSFEADQALWGKPATDGRNVFVGSLGRKVYAIDAQTGLQTWVKPLDAAVLGTMVLGADNTLYAGTYGGTVYAINPANGNNTVVQQATSWIWSGPALAGDLLYVGDANGKLFASPVAGGQSWTLDLSGAIIGSPIVNGENLIVGTEAGSVYFIGLDGKNPRPITVSGKVYSTPAAAGDLTLVAPTGGSAALVALDSSGVIRWSFTPSK